MHAHTHLSRCIQLSRIHQSHGNWLSIIITYLLSNKSWYLACADNLSHYFQLKSLYYNVKGYVISFCCSVKVNCTISYTTKENNRRLEIGVYECVSQITGEPHSATYLVLSFIDYLKVKPFVMQTIYPWGV
mgnify:FL=1